MVFQVKKLTAQLFTHSQAGVARGSSRGTKMKLCPIWFAASLL